MKKLGVGAFLFVRRGLVNLCYLMLLLIVASILFSCRASVTHEGEDVILRVDPVPVSMASLGAHDSISCRVDSLESVIQDMRREFAVLKRKQVQVDQDLMDFFD